MPKLREYSGLLSLHTYGEADDILFLSSVSEPFCEELQWMVGKSVTVRYWLTDKPCTKEEAQAEWIQHIFGKADGDFGARYSELTGYLWTDEELNVGGHDLMKRLRGGVGKWLHMEIEVAP